MHAAYCAGWLRHGMETPLPYALWLGYDAFDQGMPDQSLGCDGNRSAPLSWARRAEFESMRRICLAASKEDEKDRWNEFFRDFCVCATCTYIPSSRTSQQLKNQHSHQGKLPNDNVTTAMFIDGEKQTFTNCRCIPRQTNLEGIFYVPNWFEVDPVYKINHSLEHLAKKGLYYEMTCANRTTKAGTLAAPDFVTMVNLNRSK